MALPPTTTIHEFLASSAASTRPPSPMESDDEGNPLYAAYARLDYDLSHHTDDPSYTKECLCTFLTNASPAFPQGIPHALGLHIAPEPLAEALTAQAELIRALTAKVRGLAAMVHKRLPPPQTTAPAPPPSKQPPAQPSPPKPPTSKPPTPPKAQTPPLRGPASSSLQPLALPLHRQSTRPPLSFAYLNDMLSHLFPGTSLSAAWWTKNNNLVIVAGPDTTSHHLQKASAILSCTVSHFIAADTSKPVSISVKENIRWSCLLVNNIPTGVSPTRGAYSPSECQDALTRDNPAYRTLHLTRLPSWVKRPDGYAVGSSSSLVVSFEDPTGDALRTLLAQKRLFAFGQAGDLQVWKQKPRAPASPPTS
ncbi:hypothetical protein EDB86DRAFT_3083932 [Lactarius hatsudake]|nr:hypothetical protein EDB86DRAFT_3083932 [Lactarius hatsudake]